jgi:adenylate cyclase
MAVFGSPISAGDDTLRAVMAAVEMQEANRRLNEQRAARNQPLFEMGIGVATGDVIAGYVGSPERMEFTVIGDRVNTARRFCSVAEANQIVAGEDTFKAVESQVDSRDLGEISLKGKDLPVRAYQILGMREFSRGTVA